MSSRALQDLCPEMYGLCMKWIAECEAAGLRVGVSQTYRSDAEQDADYAQGRTAPGKIITNARAGESPHNCVDINGNPASKAFDFFIYAADGTTQLDWDASDPQWLKAISIGTGLGLVSGSTFAMKDNDHFELPNWDSDDPTNSD